MDGEINISSGKVLQLDIGFWLNGELEFRCLDQFHKDIVSSIPEHYVALTGLGTQLPLGEEIHSWRVPKYYRQKIFIYPNPR